MRLSHRDFDALQKAILELYALRDMDAFKRALPEVFLKIIPADYFCLGEHRIGTSARGSTASDYLESEPRISPEGASFVESRVLEHPFTKHFMAGGEMTALKVSDFLTLNQVKRSDYFQEFYLIFGGYCTLSVPVSGGGGTAALSVVYNRSKDFTERDRLMMNLMRPHYNQARRNAELLTSLQKAGAKPMAEYGLSPSESGVAQWLARGKTNPEIAIILESSARTIEKHVERILEKLGVENRTTAALALAGAQVNNLPPP